MRVFVCRILYMCAPTLGIRVRACVCVKECVTKKTHKTNKQRSSVSLRLFSSLSGPFRTPRDRTAPHSALALPPRLPGLFCEWLGSLPLLPSPPLPWSYVNPAGAEAAAGEVGAGGSCLGGAHEVRSLRSSELSPPPRC